MPDWAPGGPETRSCPPVAASTMTRDQPPRTGPPSMADRVLGCLLGGAVGDALGAPVEFMSLDTIRTEHGPRGVTGFPRDFSRPGLFTDDTQMTLWTVEGLIRARRAVTDGGEWEPVGHVNRAYLRWLITQGQPVAGNSEGIESGWLIAERGLWARRAPGNTCLSALRAGGMGTPGEPINDSKGCGGVMRVAPVGFQSDEDVFGLGRDLAALTHGHPSGYLAAGALARVIASVAQGESLESAVAGARDRVAGERGSAETVAAIDAALRLAESGPPTAEAVETLGQGWVAEEALAISLYCALVADTFDAGVLLAVNHSGDSDSTGSITGQILGAIHGPGVIPEEWLGPLELRDVIERLAADFTDTYVSGSAPSPDHHPGW